MLLKLKKPISLTLCFLLILQQSVLAQSIGAVDISRYLDSKPPVSILRDTFRPVHLRYLSYDSLNNSFKLLLDQGSPQPYSKPLPVGQAGASEQVTRELLKYFLIGLTLPNSSFWVNLRPDAPDNIIDDDLAKTDVGKILLEADLNLKKDTSNWTSPQTPEGKAYWDKLYQKAGELYGSENITIPTLTRPWIVPDEIILRESPEGAYIYKATLKVMLEEDYLSRGGSRTAPTSGRSRTAPTLDGSRTAPTMRTAPTYQQYTFSDPRLKELNEYSTQLIKELIIPKLTREINSSRRYAPLRQVYYSLILAQHFKKKLTSKSGPYFNLIDSRDLTNLTSPEPWDKRTYFKEYQKSFQEGEYKLKANQSTIYGQVIRRYMSGGVELGNGDSLSLIIPAKDNRIINHPEILKVSSAILPGDLKAFGRPTSSPAAVYVSEAKDLRFSDNPKIKRIWDEMIEENLKLYKFAQELTRLSRKYGVIKKFPEQELGNLRKLYNNLNQKYLAYNLGFITFNSGIKTEDDSLLPAQFKFNLLFLVSMVYAKIKPAELFNEERSNARLISEDDLAKIATGGKLKEGDNFYEYTWKPFKEIKSFIWKEIGEKKVNGFFKKFESLLGIFQQERESYHEITRVRYAGEKPYMIILEQYRDQLRALINSPWEYIEQQEPIAKYAPEGGKIGDVVKNPGGLLLPGESVGKVRKFTLNGLEFYAKRVNPLWTRYPEEEIVISLKVAQSLKEISPYFGVQEFVGIIYDQGAFYLLSRAIVDEQPRLEATKDQNYFKQFKSAVVEILVNFGVPEAEIQNLVVNKFGKDYCVFLDFETHPNNPVKDVNKAPEALKGSLAVEGEEKPSAIPEETKEADLEKILKTFSLNSPDWLGESLKNKIAEDYGGISVLEPIITDQYGQWNDVSRLSDETMNKLKARLNKEEVNEYFYLPIITKHSIKVLTSKYWVNSYNYKVVIAKKPALEKLLNYTYTYRNIVEGDDDVLLLWEFTVRLGNKPPTIILEQQGIYKELRGQGFISKAYRLFVQCLAEKFPGWQVEGEFENLEKHETPPALALFKEYFLEPQSLYTGQVKSTPGYTESAIWKAKIPSSNSSSSLVGNPGGVDLRALPITTQSLNHPLMANMPLSGSAVSLDINFDNELRQIQDMLNAGIMPSSERIREYALASSSLKPEDYSREIDRLFSCIADIFRLEEEKAKPTPQALKDALILLESNKPA